MFLAPAYLFFVLIGHLPFYVVVFYICCFMWKWVGRREFFLQKRILMSLGPKLKTKATKHNFLN